MFKNISSHTANDQSLYPAYISINQHPEGVSLQFRPAEKISSGGQISAGEVGEIIMTEECFKRFLDDAQAGFKPSADPNQMGMKV